jgi:hypothetical protein
MFSWSGIPPYKACLICLGCGGVFNVVVEHLIAIAFAGRKSHQWLAGLVNHLATLWKE